MQIHGEFCVSRVVQQVLRADSRTAQLGPEAGAQVSRQAAELAARSVLPLYSSLKIRRSGPLRQPSRRTDSGRRCGRDGRWFCPARRIAPADLSC